MKYIDSEKLVAEIERLLKCTELHRGEAVAEASRQTLYWIKDFITFLQQEQPAVDLDREIIKYKVPFIDDKEYLDETTLDAIAHHFYKLGLNARKEGKLWAL